MKYSRLPQKELETLESDFIKFLVMNGITADDWIVIKENEPLNAEKIIEQFSDVVWEGVLRNVKYLDKDEQDYAYFFKCNEDNIELIRILKAKDQPLKQIVSKKYSKLRELELFDMINNGCVISQGQNFRQLL